MTEYWMLNYEISPWLPKNSVWYRKDSGEWGGESKSHTLGQAGEDSYWFTLMLEQERSSPSGTMRTPRIITRVERIDSWAPLETSP